MEPPSSVNDNQKMTAGSPVDDPLSCFSTTESYIVVNSLPSADDDGDNYVVCGYSPCTGISYFGTTRTSIKS